MENEIIQTNDTIRTKILVLRGQQVMIDRDLAELYGVETKRLNEQVKRNAERFPENFCFQLNETEFENWRSQFATSNSDKMGLRRPPYAFTEQGVAMLSAVLHSDTAVQVSIQIMNAFVAMRHIHTDAEDYYIGILLCSETDKTVAKYSVLNDSKQIFASKYLTLLPTEKELADEIERQKEIFIENHTDNVEK